MTMDYR